MFYAKIWVDGKHMSVALTHMNVYGLCSVCHEETNVDLAEVFKGNNDRGLYKTPVICPECQRKELLKLFKGRKKVL